MQEKTPKRGRPPMPVEKIIVELEHMPGKDSEEALLQALEMLLSDRPVKTGKRKQRRGPEQGTVLELPVVVNCSVLVEYADRLK
jgi:hypothetical protein